MILDDRILYPYSDRILYPGEKTQGESGGNQKSSERETR